MIDESGTGRAGVKFGQFMGSVLLASAGVYYAGYASFPVAYSDTAMITDDDEKSLYVINSKTSDVTIFDAHTLSGKHSLPTGAGTFAVFKLNQEFKPGHSEKIMVMAANRLNYIDVNTHDIVHKVDYQTLVNFDVEEDLFIVQNKDKSVPIYRLSSGALMATIPASKSFYDLVYDASSSVKK